MEFILPQFDQGAPKRATPQETEITRLAVTPYEDGYRIRVNLEITPFEERPSIELTLNDAQGEEVASTSILEPMGWKLEFTLHIRGELCNPYTLSARLYYPDGPQKEPVQAFFKIEPPDQGEAGT